jgi:excisionase family DNA binding protein
MKEPQLLSVEATGQQLSVSPWTVFQLIREGKLQSVKIGKRRLVPESAIADYIAGLREVS